MDDATGSGVAASEIFGSEFTTYNKQMCLVSSLCYKFTLNDSYGDGISSDGSFDLMVDGEVLLSNPNSGFTTLEAEFGNCSENPTPTPPAPSTNPPTQAPITVVNPTSNPTYHSTDLITPFPTISPQNCDDILALIEVITDGYPEENSWTLVSSSGEVVQSEVFYEQDTLYQDTLCLSKDECHVFTMNDSYGDGIFSDGGFKLSVGNVVILSNPEYEEWSSLDATFGACTSEPTESPTTSPSKSPTKAPTDSPTDSPTLSSCGSDSSEVAISVVTDSYPGEVSWELATVGGSTVSSEPFTELYTTYESTYCVDAADCHKFTILDTYGDGLLSGGDFSLSVDGKELLSDPIQGWEMLEVEFGQCGTPSTRCGADEVDVEISVKTDDYPNELSWMIVPNDGFNGSTINSERFIEEFATYENSYCLPKSICHKFIMKDSWGDGIRGVGDFTLAVDQKVILQDTNEGWYAMSATFGDC